MFLNYKYKEVDENSHLFFMLFYLQQSIQKISYLNAIPD